MNTEQIKKTYLANLDSRDGVRLQKKRMDANEYIIAYRQADRRVQRSKMTMRKHGISFQYDHKSYTIHYFKMISVFSFLLLQCITDTKFNMRLAIHTN